MNRPALAAAAALVATVAAANYATTHYATTHYGLVAAGFGLLVPAGGTFLTYGPDLLLPVVLGWAAQDALPLQISPSADKGATL